jgi:hypothetical protein
MDHLDEKIIVVLLLPKNFTISLKNFMKVQAAFCLLKGKRFSNSVSNLISVVIFYHWIKKEFV